MKESLFHYLEKSHQPSLRFTDAESASGKSWEEMIIPLPVAPESPKNLIFLYLDNSRTSVQFFLSALKTPHCLCLLNAGLASTLKTNLEEIYKPEYILDKAREQEPGKMLLSESGLSFWETGNKSSPLHPSLKILLTTSGTTGSQKLVKLSDANFIANTRSILDFLPVAHTDSCILNLPIHYSYGLSVLLTNIAKGGNIVCTNETVLMRSFWDLFRARACNSLNGVPYTYEMILRAGFEKMEGLNMKYLTQAGGKLGEKALQAMTSWSLRNKTPFYVMYGQTEATARMSFLPPELLAEKPGSIGKPISGGAFEIEEDSRELVYTGPNVGAGYSESREDLREFLPQSRLHTGDQARRDEENYFYITGRLKRFIKLFGNRINLDDLEQELRGKFECMVGCSGYEDKHLLVFSDQSTLLGKEVQDYIFGKFQVHPSVVKYLHLDSIPLTASHKINYRLINETYGR
ncbi:MAG TPA: AMP-binding protein [Bacteroidia bacterium]|jgi:long-subunit acyl-CoA synthetase (AMP-forming)|nr:AMP-binding protein [Bacteroidia bacterium]